jgi:hypothetical protein
MILLFMPETKGKTLESWIRSFLCRRGSMLGMGWGKLGISLIGTGWEGILDRKFFMRERN